MSESHEILRRAERQIRAMHGNADPFMAAIADWLEDEVAQAKSYPDDTLVEIAFAAPLRVARAYLKDC